MLVSIDKISVLVRTGKDAEIVLAGWWDDGAVVASDVVVRHPSKVLPMNRGLSDVDIIDQVELGRISGFPVQARTSKNLLRRTMH